MARLPRLYLSGCAQHIIQRGNNRELCFFDDADNKAYFQYLKLAEKNTRYLFKMKNKMTGSGLALAHLDGYSQYHARL